MYYGGVSGRGVGKILRMNKSNVMNWIKKAICMEKEQTKIVEMDELYWFLEYKPRTETRENVYIITMVSRKPRQILGHTVSRNKMSGTIQRMVDAAPEAECYCTIDDSDFNIIISNTQKIIVKKKRKETSAAETLFSGSGSLLSAVYGGDDDEDDAWDDSTLMDNQRFKKLCRLPQLGVYVDEAHHLFGADLERQIRSSGANKTSLRDTINLLAENTSIVACYNYTGTPYVKNQLLPEVVYAYGLRESIWNGFLKDADPLGFENVKSDEFLKAVVTTFWERYGGKTYEGLNPKLAIYAAGVEEAATEVKPALERILANLGIPTSKILLNVGDAKYTKNDDIRDFNNLDVPGTEGNKKQFIILVEKGKEGWNCRSLFAVALFRSPKSKIFVLQATMRCLRAITDERLTATVFLSKENYDTLDDELHKNFNMEIKDIKNPSNADRHKYQVRVLPPPRTITLKRVWHEYTLHEKEYSEPVDFKLVDADLSKYASIMYERDSLARDIQVLLPEDSVSLIQLTPQKAD